ncbi:hypothetical protein HDU67_008507 [Dinochytrium kinnereticum]|nr:hypothetical protein HDU67_008507 [Dinochytrium kinnereticum]
MESVDAAASRFMRELEFVQCLANPKYLQFLAQNRYFEDEAFLNYLKYLSYWREPKYSKFIVYPYCLEMLMYLQYKAFRDAVASEESVNLIHQKEFYHWSSWRARHPGPFPEDEETDTQQQTEPEIVHQGGARDDEAIANGTFTPLNSSDTNHACTPQMASPALRTPNDTQSITTIQIAETPVEGTPPKEINEASSTPPGGALESLTLLGQPLHTEPPSTLPLTNGFGMVTSHATAAATVDAVGVLSSANPLPAQVAGGGVGGAQEAMAMDVDWQ